MDIGYGAPVAHPYERWLLRVYAHRLVEAETRGGRRAPRLAVARWLSEHRAHIGARTFPRAFVAGDDGRIDRATNAALAPARARLADALGAPAPTPSLLERRVGAIAQLLGLAPRDRDILAALARSILSRPLRDLLQRMEGSDGEGWYEEQTALSLIAVLLGVPQTVLRARLRDDAPLALYGFAQERRRGEIALSAQALALLREPSASVPALRRRLLGRGETPSLAWRDFAHIEGRDAVEALVAAALRTNAAGVNVLLYGPNGAGKTEFARVLGARLGASAIFAGEARHGGHGELSRNQRIGDVALRRMLARQNGRALVIVDEADDIFTGADAWGAWRRGSKAFVNRFVEDSQTPTLWIVNDPELLGPAILRRMSYALRFSTPSRGARERIVARLATRARIALDATQMRALVALNAAPAVVAHAMRTAQLVGADGAAALDCARANLRVMEGPAPTQAPQPVAYDAAMLRADADLVALAARVVEADTRALSFCFHGLPGSGKSAFARYLADKMGLDVVERRASDLLSKWIGDTERAIREAFEEASDRRAFLIFDEADSLLASREGAQRSWEVTQVNEMLVCMERHLLPFACTTNTFQALDPASLRRFVFKVGFLPMARAQIETAFAAAFGARAPAPVLALGNLTPGDFAVVARKAQVLKEADAAVIAQWLAEESAAKPGQSRRIGF